MAYKCPLEHSSMPYTPDPGCPVADKRFNPTRRQRQRAWPVSALQSLLVLAVWALTPPGEASDGSGHGGYKLYYMPSASGEGSSDMIPVCRAIWPFYQIYEQAKSTNIDTIEHPYIINSWATFPWLQSAAGNCSAVIFSVRRRHRSGSGSGGGDAGAAHAGAHGGGGAAAGHSGSGTGSSQPPALRKVALLSVVSVMGDPEPAALAKAWWDLLSQYGVHASTRAAYAHMMGYDFVVHSSKRSFQDTLPPVFAKVPALQHLLYALGYEMVLYADWDTYISPHALTSVEALASVKPGATVYLQEWENQAICAGVFILRNVPMAKHFLNTWWRWAEEGCCPVTRFPRDQLAFQHVIRALLVNETAVAEGNPWLDRNELFSTKTFEGPETRWIERAKSTASVGVIGWREQPPEVYGPLPGVVASRVQLTSCAGLWGEGNGGPCLPQGVTALLHHIGGAYAAKCCEYYRPVLRQVIMDHALWALQL